MSDNFVQAFSDLIGNEGGYFNDPEGETMWGVKASVARKWGYSGPMKDLPLDTARKIAKDNYWTPNHCDDMDERLAFQILDISYNGGHPLAWLQSAVGVTPDGRWGPATAEAVKSCDIHTTIMRLNASRLEYMTRCPEWSYAGKGWARRVASNLRKGI